MDRFQLRERYIAGWCEMDLAKLLSTVADDFVFDDPAEPGPVSAAGLEPYMASWSRRAGFKNDWRLTHQVRQDQSGLLTDWSWWEVIGTPLHGAALVTTSDQGVHLERIAYFQRAP